MESCFRACSLPDIRSGDRPSSPPERATPGCALIAAPAVWPSPLTGLTAHLPADLKPTLQALFEYRNNMFHFCFEWPTNERERFQKRTADWPSDWFSMATIDHKPWIFYLTDAFIDHCLTIIDSVLGGVGVLLAINGLFKKYRPRCRICSKSYTTLSKFFKMVRLQ